MILDTCCQEGKISPPWALDGGQHQNIVAPVNLDENQQTKFLWWMK